MATTAVPKFPVTVQAGAEQVTIRHLAPDDRAALLAFARSLPEHDLLFLQRDITQEEVIDEWLRETQTAQAATLIAETPAGIVGYTTVYRSGLRWTAHVGELRVVVGPQVRGQGLGRILTQQAFEIARTQGIEKMVAQMTLDQEAAIATFQGLGFRAEAVLRDHVRDRTGRKHDLLVLSHDVARFEIERATYGIIDAFNRQ
jgi:L-amino acid N-acyltransferase YncA